MAGRAHKSVPEVISELWQLLRDYARQETLGPLKNLGGYLKFGVPGAVLVLTGILFLAMGVLRGLQRFAFTAYGLGSSVPYLGAIAFLALVLGSSTAVVVRTKNRQLPNGGKFRVPDLDRPKEAA